MLALCEQLQASRATVNRLLAYLREQLGLDVRYDRDHNGYFLQRDRKTAGTAALMGLTYSETAALLEALVILEQIPPGIVRHASPEARSGMQRLSRHHLWDGGLASRIEIRLLHQRKVLPKVFATVVDALRDDRRIDCTYHNRYREAVRTREISPIRLVHYRSNWYLAGWCHADESVRVFSLDRFSTVQKLATAAHRPSARVVERELDSGYGIFTGDARRKAVLRFEPEVARWVAEEQWHRDATCERCPDGAVRLTVPYSAETELIMEVLRYGPGCVVEAPDSLRRNVAKAHREAACRYGDD
jgi:predicted DNA-binding transcriptional regulator YafY